MKQNLTIFPDNPTTWLLSGPAGSLEILTNTPKEAGNIVTIICHPHPLYQGTMNNKVVHTIARACHELHQRSVRFNFRGVGKSTGSYGNGVGEIEDLRTVIQWVQKVRPNDEIWLAGFSFGGYIASALAHQPFVKQLITVAPAVKHFNFSALPTIYCPWLIIQGDQDKIVDPHAVAALATKNPAHPKIAILPGAGHFFHGFLVDLKTILLKT
jgi:uncharacterized protein